MSQSGSSLFGLRWQLRLGPLNEADHGEYGHENGPDDNDDKGAADNDADENSPEENSPVHRRSAEGKHGLFGVLHRDAEVGGETDHMDLPFPAGPDLGDLRPIGRHADQLE